MKQAQVTRSEGREGMAAGHSTTTPRTTSSAARRVWARGTTVTSCHDAMQAFEWGEDSGKGSTSCSTAMRTASSGMARARGG